MTHAHAHEKEHVGAAIGLVCLAGGAAAIGASIVFFPSIVKRTSCRVLAASLGLSAGVMIYISFVDIFVKSVDGFVDAGMERGRAYAYASASFFGGVSLMMIIDLCIKCLTREPPSLHRDQEEDIQIIWNKNEDSGEINEAEQHEITVPGFGGSDDPVGELNGWHEKAELELQAREEVLPTLSVTEESVMEESSTLNGDEERGVDHNNNQEEIKERGQIKGEGPIMVIVENVPRSQDDSDRIFGTPYRSKITPKEEKRKLVKMGMSTAAAITLHSFPEGLATFVAVLDDPSIGAVLAIAIGLHNVPEGFCVALPIYYATGDRWRAFRWGCLAGISEPIAAILGWLLLANRMTDEAYAILFGLVSGIMLMISLKELIPSAHRYDPQDTVVTYSIVTGMLIMGISLVLFYSFG